MKSTLKKIESAYESIKETSLPYRRFKHNIVLQLLENLKSNSLFGINEIGRSIEGRSIHSVSIGTGNTKILLWTQMHGNESTATRGVFDFLNYCNSENFSQAEKQLFENVTITIIPVLNPDGMERYQRRNAIDVDPNRDALKKSTPEIKILFEQIEKLKPDWCFNMHDQRNLFNVSGTSCPATLSFLSPSTADGVRSQNQNDGMMMIDKINQYLQDFIPNKIGRFTHEYYPTASGDNIQSMGYRTILVESGGHVKDTEREVGRKMNYLLIWKAIELSAYKEWQKGTLLRYSEIPQNDQKLFDLLIRNVGICKNGITVLVDVGVDRMEVAAKNPEGFVIKSKIRDLGDLSFFYGYEEVDAKGAIANSDIVLNDIAQFELELNGKLSLKVENGFLTYG